MRKPNNATTRLETDLKALKIGDTLAHYINLKLRQAAYDVAQKLEIKLCIQRVPSKLGRFQITRIR
jgi:hypothetical protein